MPDAQSDVIGDLPAHRISKARSVQDLWVDMSYNGMEPDLDGHPEHLQSYGTPVDVSTADQEGEHLWRDNNVRLAGWTGLQLEIAASEVRGRCMRRISHA